MTEFSFLGVRVRVTESYCISSPAQYIICLHPCFCSQVSMDIVYIILIV